MQLKLQNTEHENRALRAKISDELAQSKAQFEKEIEAARTDVKEHLQPKIRALEAENIALKNQMADLVPASEARRAEELQLKLQNTEHENRALSARAVKVSGQLDDAEGRMRRLSKLASDRNAQISKLDQEIKALKRAASAPTRREIDDKLTIELLKALFSGVRYPVIHAHRARNLVDLVKQLNLVDSSWYLQQYPDVASSKWTAEEHFVRFGAREGRAPSVRLPESRAMPARRKFLL